jgi:hypothetical protein
MGELQSYRPALGATMRRLALALVPLLLLSCDRDPAAPDIARQFDATHSISNVFDFAWSALINADFGATCMPEEVYASGSIHFIVLETISSSGHYMSKFQGEPQGLTGIGLTSGMTYRFAGVTQDVYTVQGDGFPLTETFVNRFRVIGPGPDNNFVWNITLKVTVNGVGDWIVSIEDESVQCR